MKEQAFEDILYMIKRDRVTNILHKELFTME